MCVCEQRYILQMASWRRTWLADQRGDSQLCLRLFIPMSMWLWPSENICLAWISRNVSSKEAFITAKSRSNRLACFVIPPLFLGCHLFTVPFFAYRLSASWRNVSGAPRAGLSLARKKDWGKLSTDLDFPHHKMGFVQCESWIMGTIRRVPRIKKPWLSSPKLTLFFV